MIFSCQVRALHVILRAIMMDVLCIEDLSKNYGSFAALKGLNLKIQKGQCVGLLGSNGAGKSTTIRIITGQLRPTSGQVRVLGIDPSREPKKIHPFIGYIPDTQTLYDDLSVEKNIEIFAELFGQPKNSVKEILGQVTLLEKKSGALSKIHYFRRTHHGLGPQFC